jgi:hypothetical protein
MAQDYRTLKLEVLAETKQFVKGMNDANKETLSFGDKLGDFAKKAGVALAAVGAAAGAMAIKVGKEAVAAASDLAESTSKVQVIFGNASEEIRKFASQAASSLGQTRTQAQNAASTFATFGKAAGLTGQDLSKFSIEFVKLASDLASFNNTSVDQAIVALGAALRGESEPIRSYGVLLNDATLKAKAMEMGIYNGTGTLTAQQKVLAAHKVVLAQTTDAQGDFARTADGMANSQRILNARLEEAKITLGEALLPIALNVVNFFNDRFLPIIEKLAGAFSSPNGTGVTDRIKEFVTQARDFLNPIVEAIRGAFDRVSSAISTNKGNFESILTAVKSLYDFFNTYLVPIIKNQVVSAIEGIGIAFSAVIKVISPIIGFISDVVNGIVNVVDRAIRAILSLVNTAVDAINAAINAYNRIPVLPNVPTVPKIGTSGTAGVGSNTVPSSSLPSGFTSGTKSTPSGIANPATGTLAGNALGNALASALGGGSKTLGAGTKPGMTLIEQVTEENFLKSLETDFDVARARRGEEKSNQPVTINVNAPSVIDEEAFTRAVVFALNSATNRGTGGGGSLKDTAQIL